MQARPIKSGAEPTCLSLSDQRQGRPIMRIASFNVENLFDRAKALNRERSAAGRQVLAAQAELTSLLEEAAYAAPVKARILELLRILGLERSDDSEFVRLRKIRGKLLRRPMPAAQAVANGRADWIGWIELKTEPVDEWAMQHTAMVMRDIDAEIMGVVEADSRPGLEMFSRAWPAEVGGKPYEQVMLIDGNDERGIDVGIMARGLPAAADRDPCLRHRQRRPDFQSRLL